MNLIALVFMGLVVASVYSRDLSTARIKELESDKSKLTQKLKKADKDMEDCIMENSLLNARIDETVRKFS